MESFRKSLVELLNKYSKENDSNTPDFILAEYLMLCLEAYNKTLQVRESWYGRNIERLIDNPMPKPSGLLVKK